MEFKGNLPLQKLVPTNNGATKNDSDYLEKPPMDLIPQAALKEVAKVLGFGATKYDRHNWRKGMDHGRLSSAALRHIGSYLDEELYDDESGLEHLAHAACCILMLLESRIKGYGNDDRR